MPARQLERAHRNTGGHITHWIGGAPRESADELLARVRGRLFFLRGGLGDGARVRGTEGAHFCAGTEAAVTARWADPTARPSEALDPGFAAHG